MNAREIAVKLAVLKAVKDRLDSVWQHYRALAAEELDPGDRKRAVLPDGSEIGSVSYSRQGDGKWAVTDDDAFIGWLRDTGRDSALVPTLPSGTARDALIEYLRGHAPELLAVTYRASDAAAILAKIDTGELDEIPPGVTLVPGRAPTISVTKQTDEHVRNIERAWSSGQVALPEILALPAGGDDR